MKKVQFGDKILYLTSGGELWHTPEDYVHGRFTKSFGVVFHDKIHSLGSIIGTSDDLKVIEETEEPEFIGDEMLDEFLAGDRR